MKRFLFVCQDFLCYIYNTINNKQMKKIKEMVDSALSKRDAMQMLETWRIFRGLNDTLYNKGKIYIKEVWG